MGTSSAGCTGCRAAESSQPADTSRLHPPQHLQLAALRAQHDAFPGRRHDAGERGDVDLMRADDQHPRPLPLGQDAPRRGALGVALLGCLEEGIEPRVLLRGRAEGERGRVPGAAPLRAEHGADADAPRAKRLPDAPRLTAPGVVEVALGRAVAEAEARRIAATRRIGMAEQHDRPVAQGAPAVVGGGLGLGQRGDGAAANSQRDQRQSACPASEGAFSSVEMVGRHGALRVKRNSKEAMAVVCRIWCRVTAELRTPPVQTHSVMPAKAGTHADD